MHASTRTKIHTHTLQISPSPRPFLLLVWAIRSGTKERYQQIEARPPLRWPTAFSPAALSHVMPTRLGVWAAGAEQLCDGHGFAPSDLATRTCCLSSLATKEQTLWQWEKCPLIFSLPATKKTDSSKSLRCSGLN